MFERIGKFVEIVHAILSIWLYRITVAKEKKEEVNALAQEADKAISDRRYDDVVVIWSRMRNV